MLAIAIATITSYRNKALESSKPNSNELDHMGPMHQSENCFPPSCYYKSRARPRFKPEVNLEVQPRCKWMKCPEQEQL